MAPEVYLRERVGHPGADIFSYGRLMQFLATGVPPLHGVPPPEIRSQLKAGYVAQISWPTTPNSFQKGCLPLARVCLVEQPEHRPSAPTLHDQLMMLPSELFDDQMRTTTRLALEMKGARLLDQCFQP